MASWTVINFKGCLLNASPLIDLQWILRFISWEFYFQLLFFRLIPRCTVNNARKLPSSFPDYKNTWGQYLRSKMSVKGDEDLSKRTLWERFKEPFYKERFEKCKKCIMFSPQDLPCCRAVSLEKTLAVCFLEDCVNLPLKAWHPWFKSKSSTFTTVQILSVFLFLWYVLLKLKGIFLINY